MLVSLIAAVVAAIFYGVASVMQAIAVRAASNRPPEEANAASTRDARADRSLLLFQKKENSADPPGKTARANRTCFSQSTADALPCCLNEG